MAANPNQDEWDSSVANVPRVFISYSHDSADHKRWVYRLASTLMGNGVEVILDQWDLRLGDDVPKFMEKSVSGADRVLMVCSETYVSKANDGKGGVGYEAMVVTGELVRDLGTSKFIPIVRQRGAKPVTPRCVSTRFYVDFSDDEQFDDSIRKLLEELHGVPTVAKPKLGISPFPHEPPVHPPTKIDSLGGFDWPDFDRDPSSANLVLYDSALELARADDRVAWRRAFRDLKRQVHARLAEWRAERERDVRQHDQTEQEQILMEGALKCFPLMAVALAGVESGQAWFSKQSGIVDDLLNVPGWEPSGSVFVIRSLRAFACIYHTLHGAMCVQTEQLPLALRLAETRVQIHEYQQVQSLYRTTPLTGFLESLNQNWEKTADFLYQVPEAWPWLRSLYGSNEDLMGCIGTYFLALNILELTDDLVDPSAASQLFDNSGAPLIQYIPSCFFIRTPDVTFRTQRLVRDNADSFCQIWRSKGIKDQRMKEAWPKRFAQVVRSHHIIFFARRPDAAWYEKVIDDLLT